MREGMQLCQCDLIQCFPPLNTNYFCHFSKSLSSFTLLRVVGNAWNMPDNEPCMTCPHLLLYASLDCHLNFWMYLAFFQVQLLKFSCSNTVVCFYSTVICTYFSEVNFNSLFQYIVGFFFPWNFISLFSAMKILFEAVRTYCTSLLQGPL